MTDEKGKHGPAPLNSVKDVQDKVVGASDYLKRIQELEHTILQLQIVNGQLKKQNQKLSGRKFEHCSKCDEIIVQGSIHCEFMSNCCGIYCNNQKPCVC